MIIVDFSGITVASGAIAFKMEGSSGDRDLDKSYIRHLVLNTLRAVNIKYRKKYGQIVIAIDNKNYWRRGIFPGYKAARKEKRKENDKVPWELIFEVAGELEVDLVESFNYVVINVEGGEADDVIGTLVQDKSEQPSPEPIMIISNDGDMKQLQRYPNVKQYSTMQSKMVIEKDPAYWLKEKCIRGDKKDGIPNMYSKLSHFVKTPEIRQKAITKVFLASIMNRPVASLLSEQELGRYKQNEILLDFRKIPEKIRVSILDKYEEIDDITHVKSPEDKPKQTKIFEYLTKNGMQGLVDSITDF